MLDSLKSFLSELTDGSRPAERFGPDDYRLASAALLVHAATIDGNETAAEHAMLHDLLKSRFALDETATAELIEKATTADREAIDLYHFTSLINRHCGLEDRVRMIEMMWEIACADGRITEFEDNLLWRVADLLGVSSHERIALRQRVSEHSSETA